MNKIVPGSRLVGKLSNASVSTDWETTSMVYTPHANATWASIIVLNWAISANDEDYSESLYG